MIEIEGVFKNTQARSKDNARQPYDDWGISLLLLPKRLTIRAKFQQPDMVGFLKAQLKMLLTSWQN